MARARSLLGERHPGRTTRNPKWPDRVEVPDFTLDGAPGGIRPDRYEATRTVLRRKGQPYVLAAVRIERIGGYTGRSLAYALEGRTRSPYRFTVDSRAHPPLGRTQRHEGAKALAALRAEVTEALVVAGWRALPEGGEWWQPPEGTELDSAEARRAERASLLEAVERVLAAVLDGRKADLVTADYGGREWGVTAHRTAAGQAVVVLSPGLPVAEVPAGEATGRARLDSREGGRGTMVDGTTPPGRAGLGAKGSLGPGGDHNGRGWLA